MKKLVILLLLLTIAGCSFSGQNLEEIVGTEYEVKAKVLEVQKSSQYENCYENNDCQTDKVTVEILDFKYLSGEKKTANISGEVMQFKLRYSANPANLTRVMPKCPTNLIESEMGCVTQEDFELLQNSNESECEIIIDRTNYFEDDECVVKIHDYTYDLKEPELINGVIYYEVPSYFLRQSQILEGIEENDIIIFNYFDFLDEMFIETYEVVN